MQTLPEDIVDCVVGIMDERPEPMRNFKPVQKIKNGLERFWATHQEGYEARRKRSGGRVDRVNRHNAAYPKMIDELEKRRSMTKMAGINKKEVKFRRDPICNGCVKVKKAKARRYKSKAKTKPRSHRVASRIKKHNINSKVNKRKTLPSYFATTGCQCAYVLVKDKNLGTDFAGILKMESKLNVNISRVMADNGIGNAPKAPSSSSSKRQAKSVNSSKYPDTSIASMSTYNSFATIDQEPMV